MFCNRSHVYNVQLQRIANISVLQTASEAKKQKSFEINSIAVHIPMRMVPASPNIIQLKSQFVFFTVSDPHCSSIFSVPDP